MLGRTRDWIEWVELDIESTKGFGWTLEIGSIGYLGWTKDCVNQPAAGLNYRYWVDTLFWSNHNEDCVTNLI